MNLFLCLFLKAPEQVLLIDPSHENVSMCASFVYTLCAPLSSPNRGRCHIPGSINRSPSSLSAINIANNNGDNDGASNSASLSSDWEVLEVIPDDGTVGGSNSSRKFSSVTDFLFELMQEPVWKKASQARRKAELSQQQHNIAITPMGNPSSFALLPGLTVVLGDATSPLAARLAEWLIRYNVDRVCLVRGGVTAVLGAPGGTEHFVCSSLVSF